MNEAIQQYKTKITEYWSNRTKNQKIGFIGGICSFCHHFSHSDHDVFKTKYGTTIY